MYFLTTSGIGYSEQLCKDVVDWFITKFLPRHKLYIDIRHDDLKVYNGTGFSFNGANVPRSRYHRFGGSSTLRGYDEQYFTSTPVSYTHQTLPTSDLV